MRVRRLLSLLAVAMLVETLMACSIAEQPLSTADLASVANGSNAIVLLRIVIQDKEGQFLRPFYNRDSSFAKIDVGDFENGGAPFDAYGSGNVRMVRVLGTLARDQGWAVLMLPPGYYYFVTPGSYYAGAKSESPPRWRIEVPSKVPVVYVGTFNFVAEETGFAFGAGTVAAKIDRAAAKVTDETNAAAQAAHRDLPSLPPPVTRLAVLHTGPILLGVPPPVSSSN